MSNSPLATYTKISPNKNSPRNRAIDTITIHCTAGNKNNTARQIVDYFANTERSASCNYAVGGDGSIALGVEEKDRSWCTSSGANDHRAITIEVCSNIAGTEVTDKAYAALINLVADICKRNGIKKLVWSTVKNDRINHLNGCNMTVHRDYANKACPGEWLYSRHGEIAEKVNALLGVSVSQPQEVPTSKVLYRVRTAWADSKTQKGAFSSLKNAQRCADANPGYCVFDANGKIVYDPKTTEPAVLPYKVKITASVLNIRKGPGTNYATNGSIRDKGVYTIVGESPGAGSTAGWGKLKSGVGWISLDYCNKL